jgi:glutathione synthase/RimK-type ligase-like ATP-grasp enzyme
VKIAFQYSETGFSKRWIDYCLSKKIDFVIVDPYHTNIVEQLKNADIFFWHHHHSNFKDVLIAKKLLFALEHSGVHVFPDFRTSWHFDDKVAQKYLFEATRTPSVPSYVFYSQAEAYRWLQKVEFPIVWKLRGGAGSANVKLVKSRLSAMILVFRAFNLGFPQFNR